MNTATVPAEVSVEFYGADNVLASAECRGRTFRQGPVTVSPNAQVTFDQAPGRQPVTRQHPLPPNCIGSARILSTAPLVAIVNDALNRGVTSAVFNALGVPDPARAVSLPLCRSNHTPLRVDTGVAVMNADDQDATISIAIRDSKGAVSDRGVRQPPSSGEPPAAVDGTPARWNRYGSAVVMAR